MECKKYKVKGSFECIIKSDEENLYQAINDWIFIEDDIDEYITGFEIDVHDWEELK